VPVVDLAAAHVAVYIDPDRRAPIPITVPTGQETGTFRARVWANELRGTALVTLTELAVGQVVTLDFTSAQIDELVPPGERSFAGYWEFDRDVDGVWVGWFKGPFVVDARHRRTDITTALTVTLTSTEVTVTTAGPSLIEIAAVIHADPARVVKATYRTIAVSGVAADGRNHHDGTLATFDDRGWSVIWEGTAAQIPAQGAGDTQLQTGDIAVTRASTL
jgi:hypothetical protein